MILTADLHLTDQPEDEYRCASLMRYWNAPGIFKMETYLSWGDLADRKDRHAARLLNRMREQFKRLSSHGMVTHIIMGNHDVPMEGLTLLGCAERYRECEFPKHACTICPSCLAAAVDG